MLRAAIDDALARKPKTFDELIRLVCEGGYRVSEGKSVTFYKPRQKGIKLHTLGAGYSEAELRAVIEGKTAHNPRGKRERVNLLIDIEARLAAGKGGGYAQWAKVFNVKQMAKTLLYLQEHGIKGREELNARVKLSPPEIRRVVYRVRRGDTIYGIALKYGITQRSIRKTNNLRTSRLRIGQRLVLVIPPRAQPRLTSGKNVHVVRRGETLSSIARRHGTTVTKIRMLNNLRTTRISIGQRLKIR